MSEVQLPLDRFSPETFVQALENLVDRYADEKEPIHYRKAALGMNESTCSSCLRYFSDIGLIKAEKAGVYVPSSPVTDFFLKVGQARGAAIREMKSILSNESPIYSELQFILNREPSSIEDAAREVASQLAINKDKISRIEKAISIFIGLELLYINEEGIVHINKGDRSESEQPDGKEKETESTQDSETESLGAFNKPDVEPNEMESLPNRADPEGMEKVCSVLSDGGSWTLAEVATELDQSERSTRDSLSYGADLGFIDIEEDEYELTPRGFKLGLESNGEVHSGLFADAISEYPPYLAISNHLLSENDSQALTVDDVIKALRIEFELTGPSDDTLRRAGSTFLRTLDAAGMGNFVLGRGDKPTRLELEEFTSDQMQTTISGIASQSDDEESKEQNKEAENSSRDEEETEADAELVESEPESNSRSEALSREGPPLRISSVRIQNFRNIQDSGIIPLNNITILIGKNESGKTSTLEAIESFQSSGPYPDRDLCRDVDIGKKSETPVVTVIFNISSETAEQHYPELINHNEELPIGVKATKFADGHKEYSVDADVIPDESELPSPDIVYYKNYDIISDSVTLDDLSKEENRTFQNLLEVGDLSKSTLVESGDFKRDTAITDAETEIESRLNETWSQKRIEVNLSYDTGGERLNLYLRDQIESVSGVDEKSLTQPSQRSEGFRWFLSFYINFLAETAGDEDGHKILLLDDPAVHLHPEGKHDWMDSVEEIGSEEQIIYSSHSPYLIQKRYPSRIRTVEDGGIRGTEIGTDIFEAERGTLEPLRNALGINLGSSPFLSHRQILVEGPSEYYIISAVANYYDSVLDRDIFGWSEVAIMPVRGANDAIGKASWLESEGIDYAVLLDSDSEGQEVKERIQEHREDIDHERVILLQKETQMSDVVIEDMIAPSLYVECFNEVYGKFTEELDEVFTPAHVENPDEGAILVGGIEYSGTRLDEVLEQYLRSQPVAEELENTNGKIELRKRQIAERISQKLNESTVDEEYLSEFNRVFAMIRDATNRRR